MDRQTIKNRINGFTIIELLVVLSVISVLSILGIAGFSKYNSNQVVQEAAKDVAAILNLAKSRAQSQVKLGTVCMANTLRLYEVKITMPNIYRLMIHCGPKPPPYLTEIINSNKLPANVTFRSAGSFSFLVLTGGVESAGQIVINAPGALTKTIVVDSIGGIKIQ